MRNVPWWQNIPWWLGNRYDPQAPWQSRAPIRLPAQRGEATGGFGFTNLGAGMGDYPPGNPYAGMQNPRAFGAQAPIQNTATQTQADNQAEIAASNGGGQNPILTSGAPYYGTRGLHGRGGVFRQPIGGTGTGGTGGVQQPITNVRLQYAQQKLDPVLGKGWSENFTRQNGRDPITFYLHSLHIDPNNLTDPKEVAYWTERAVEAATNDAKFQPGAIADWQKIHGNTPIPQEAWDTWWKIAQGNQGNPIYGGGTGINPYGNY